MSIYTSSIRQGRHVLNEYDEGKPHDAVQLYSDVTGGMVMPVPRRGEPPRHARDDKSAHEQ